MLGLRTICVSVALACATTGLTTVHAVTLYHQVVTDPSSGVIVPGTALNFDVQESDSYVVFRATAAGTNKVNLFAKRLTPPSFPPVPSEPVFRLSDDASTSAAPPDDFSITPDGERVIYEASGAIQFGFELYGRRIDASGPATRLVNTMPPSSLARIFTFRPGSDDLLVRRGGDTGVGDAVLRVADDGSAASTVSPALASTTRIDSFIATPSGERALYVARAGTEYQFYSTSLNGLPTSVLLNTPANTYLGGSRFRYSVSPDSGTVAYTQLAADGKYQLFTRRADGSGASLAIGGTTLVPATQQTPTFFPDSDTLGFLARFDSAAYTSLYVAAPDDATSMQRISDPTHDVNRFDFTAGSSRVIYSADTNGNPSLAVFDAVFSRRLDGAETTVNLMSDLPAGSTVRDYWLAPSGTDVLILTSDRRSLYRTGIGNPTATPLALFPAFTEIRDLAFTPDNASVVFTVDEDRDSVGDVLYLAPLNGVFDPLVINRDFTGDRSIHSFQITDLRDNAYWVVYRAFDEGDGLNIYAVRIPEPASAALLGLTTVLLGRRRLLSKVA